MTNEGDASKQIIHNDQNALERSNIERLGPVVKHYDWGVKGGASLVARCFAGSWSYGNKERTIDETKPYAELWIGNHPSGPSEILTSGKNEGDSARSLSPTPLPLLLKVLSVAHPLSIQCHPDANTATRLHREDSDHYPDPNPKSEVAIAVSQFEALCGFRPWVEIVPFLQLPLIKGLPGVRVKSVTSFRRRIHEQDIAAIIKGAFRCLFDLPPEVVSDIYKKLLSDLESLEAAESKKKLTNQFRIFRMLNDHYPNDNGCFAAFFMNHIVLEPGEAVFIPPGTLHAYLKGDCVECMTNSDNVIRAGLTTKHIDRERLYEVVEFQSREPALIRHRRRSSTDIQRYLPPLKDFKVLRIVLGGENHSVEITGLELGDHPFNLFVVVQGAIQMSAVRDKVEDWKSFGLGACGNISRSTFVSIRSQDVSIVSIVFIASESF